jgi:predicted nucleic acid-binding protein
VYAVLDSSSLISLAWAGALDLLDSVPVGLVVPAEVERETVQQGLLHGYPDAVAIETAVRKLPIARPVAAGTVDDSVLAVGRSHGVLVTNDMTLGRRAANLGVRWLRTADLVVLGVRAQLIAPTRAVAVLRALRSSGRITEDLASAYLKELT